MFPHRFHVSVVAAAILLLPACGVDDTSAGSARKDIAPYLLDPNDPNRDDARFEVPADAWPVEAVIDLGLDPLDADAAIAKAVARSRAGGVPVRVEEFEACDPVAAWIVESAGEPVFHWKQGFTDCDQTTRFAVVFGETAADSAG